VVRVRGKVTPIGAHLGMLRCHEVRHARELVIELCLWKSRLEQERIGFSVFPRQGRACPVCQKSGACRREFRAPRPTLTSHCRSERHFHLALLIPKGTFIPRQVRIGRASLSPFFPLNEELRPYRDALEAFVKEELSMYYLTLEVAQATFGLRIAVPSNVWAAFRAMSVLEFTDTLQEMAKKMKKHKYTKHKRGPKKKAPRSSAANGITTNPPPS
jgi:hypothetical protein